MPEVVVLLFQTAHFLSLHSEYPVALDWISLFHKFLEKILPPNWRRVWS